MKWYPLRPGSDGFGLSLRPGDFKKSGLWVASHNLFLRDSFNKTCSIQGNQGLFMFLKCISSLTSKQQSPSKRRKTPPSFRELQNPPTAHQSKPQHYITWTSLIWKISFLTQSHTGKQRRWWRTTVLQIQVTKVGSICRGSHVIFKWFPPTWPLVISRAVFTPLISGWKTCQLPFHFRPFIGAP